MKPPVKTEPVKEHRSFDELVEEHVGRIKEEKYYRDCEEYDPDAHEPFYLHDISETF